MSSNRRCPECSKNGHDKTGDHLYLMQDGYTWYCPKAEYHADGKPYREVGNVKQEVDAQGQVVHMSVEDLVEDMQDVPEGSDVPKDTKDINSSFRGITSSTYKKYGVTGEYQQGDLVALKHTLYDLKGTEVTSKIRKLPKEFFTLDKTKGIKLQLFGQKQLPSAKRLLITEGEFDAMSAYQMLKKYNVAVWSLPTGANKKALVDNLDVIQKFTKGNKELYFCMDSDEAGQKLTKELATLFPKSKHLKLDLKDANEYLEKGRGMDFVDAFWSAEVYKPDTVIRVADILDDVLKEPEVGTPWPWPTLTDKTYGRRGGEGMYVGAGKYCQRL